MFRVLLVASLAVSAALAQESVESGAAPEPYSYGYQTETHAASEQRDPQGKVTGYYMLADADGRQRRVEYIADEQGFRAKVQTNELGTKSENSADVEVLAAPPTEAQLTYQAPPQPQVSVQQQQQQARYVSVQQPARASVSYAQQQPQFVGYPGNYPGNAYGYYQGGSYGYYPAGGYYAQGANNFANGVYSYNNHLPSQYYSSLQRSGQQVGTSTVGVVGQQQQQQQQQQAGGVVGRTVSVQQPGAYVSSFRSGYQTVGAPGPYGAYPFPGGYAYGVQPAGLSYSTGSVPVGSRTVAGAPASSSSSSTSSSTYGSSGSSNYIVLKKRDSKLEEEKEAARK